MFDLELFFKSQFSRCSKVTAEHWRKNINSRQSDLGVCNKFFDKEDVKFDHALKQ